MGKDLVPIVTIGPPKPMIGVHVQSFPVKLPAKAPLPVSINQVLLDAADILDNNNNWCQGSIGNDNQVCTVGAILQAEFGNKDNVYHYNKPFRHPLTSAAVAKLAGYISRNIKTLPPPSNDPGNDFYFDIVSGWNDCKGQTKVEVVNTLRQAAKE